MGPRAVHLKIYNGRESLPVGRPVFKTGSGCSAAPGGFDSRFLRQTPVKDIECRAPGNDFQWRKRSGYLNARVHSSRNFFSTSGG